MNSLEYIEMIKNAFHRINDLHQIPLLTANNFFTAHMVPEGIIVDNLGSNSLLVWSVFESTIDLLIANGVGVPVIKGNAMNNLLGDSGLPIDSIEGYVAQKVYNMQIGQVVFRRISPIVGILRWAGIARNEHGFLIME